MGSLLLRAINLLGVASASTCVPHSLFLTAARRMLLQSKFCCAAEGQQNTPPHLGAFESSVILSCRHLKNSKCGKRLCLNFPYLFRDRSSRINSIVANTLPQDFHQLGKIDLYRRKEVDTTPWQTCPKWSWCRNGVWSPQPRKKSWDIFSGKKWFY